MGVQGLGFRPASQVLRLVVGVLLLLASVSAAAQARAWLDRERIGEGETVTLNVETDGATPPDYSPLQREFTVTGNSSSRRFQMFNGRATTRTLYAVALQPRRTGMLTIPSLQVGNERTPSLSLLVAAASPAPATRAGADVFIESEADDPSPYVQQGVGWVVRLYSAVPLVSGQIDQRAPDGASLQRIGDDTQYTRQVGERRYTVVERRFLLIPERSGNLTMPGAEFAGRGAGGFFDDLFGDRGGALKARGTPRVLRVRAVPAQAPQPWLPLHGLQLRYTSTPQDLRAGSAATLTIEANADGATAGQMPELQLPVVDGVQVFAEPPQVDETFGANGRPRVKVTRKFALVPARAGSVRLPGVRMSWWDVRAGAARVATLPPLNWQVAAGPDPASAPTTAVPAVVGERAPAFDLPAAGANQAWVLAALIFAALWLLTLVWALQRRGSPNATATAIAPRPATSAAAGASLKRALDTGDFADVAQSLCAMARPPARDIAEVAARLDDPQQRAALEAMERARWGGGDGVAARSALRQAFARGPRWARAEAPPDPVLPPLYPQH